MAIIKNNDSVLCTACGGTGHSKINPGWRCGNCKGKGVIIKYKDGFHNTNNLLYIYKKREQA